MKLHDFFPMPTLLNNAGKRSYSPTHQSQVHSLKYLLGHLAVMPFFIVTSVFLLIQIQMSLSLTFLMPHNQSTNSR